MLHYVGALGSTRRHSSHRSKVMKPEDLREIRETIRDVERQIQHLEKQIHHVDKAANERIDAIYNPLFGLSRSVGWLEGRTEALARNR